MLFVRTSLVDQVAEHLQQSIENGIIGEDRDFPSSHELAGSYGVSHNVMLKALRQLCEENNSLESFAE